MLLGNGEPWALASGGLVFQLVCHFHTYWTYSSKSTIWPKMESCLQDRACSVSPFTSLGTVHLLIPPQPPVWALHLHFHSDLLKTMANSPISSKTFSGSLQLIQKSKFFSWVGFPQCALIRMKICIGLITFIFIE